MIKNYDIIIYILKRGILMEYFEINNNIKVMEEKLETLRRSL